jgi:carbamoyl-phosphate synthase small subunit
VKGYLALEDGTVLEGQAFGAVGESFGEVVFNTGMTGYQEILTDPSYCGQIVTMTYPLIGNYGVNPVDFEATRSFVRGFVVKEFCTNPSNWRSQETLDAYLNRNRIVALAGIDTRLLTKILRTHGVMRGIISTISQHKQELLNKLQTAPPVFGPELVRTVTTPEVYHLPGSGPKVVVLDFGAKANICRSLSRLGFDLTVVPSYTTPQEILALNPAGLMLSNGPGDPADVPEAVATVKALLGKLPIYGICLGHQIIGLALGGNTYKLKFGHRGANHPVKDLHTGRVYITSQNHGFAVDAATLGKDVEVTHLNLNDQTVEGLRHKQLSIASVQYHPEAAPGPEDNFYLFGDFSQMITAFAG